MNITSPKQAFALLNKTDPLQAAEVIENHITVTHLPDVMAAIKADQNPALDMKILIKPGGFIQLTSPGVITANIILPNPNLIGKTHPGRHPRHQTHHPRGRHTPDLQAGLRPPRPRLLTSNPLERVVPHHPMDKAHAAGNRKADKSQHKIHRDGKRRTPTPQHPSLGVRTERRRQGPRQALQPHHRRRRRHPSTRRHQPGRSILDSSARTELQPAPSTTPARSSAKCRTAPKKQVSNQDTGRP